MNIIIATVKSWNIKNAQLFKQEYYEKHNVIIIENNDKLKYDIIKEINPEYIFFPHWSWIIPQEIYEKFKCVVFHMTDLPFGQGGSPLQNLIDRGIENTKISAIAVNKGIDTGDIYLNEDLNLAGTADEILMRTSNIIFSKMIPVFLENKLIPYKQSGECVKFKRRSPQQSEIEENFTLEKIYDYIRMLDGEDYPKAYIIFGNYKMEFSRASLKNGRIIADVQIIDRGDKIE